MRSVAVDNENVYLTGEYPGTEYPHSGRMAFGRFNKSTHQSEIISVSGSPAQVNLVNTPDSVWVMTDYGGWTSGINRYDKTTGIIKGFGDYNGFNYDGTDIWLSYGNKVYKYNKTTDTIDEQFDIGTTLVRIAVDGQYIWGYEDVNPYNNYNRYANIYRINKLTGQPELVKQNLLLGGWSYGKMYSDAGKLYIGSPAGRGLVEYDKLTGADIDYSAIGFGGVLSFSSDENNLWLGTYGGIFRYEKNHQWQNLTPSAMLASNNVNCVAADDLYLWAGTGSTLNRYDKTAGVWKSYSVPYQISSILPLKDELWLGTGIGLYVFNRQYETVTSTPLPVSTPVFDIRKEGSEIWLCGYNKLLKYDTVTSGWTVYPIPPFDKPAWVRVAVIEYYWPENSVFTDHVAVVAECALVPGAEHGEIEMQNPETGSTTELYTSSSTYMIWGQGLTYIPWYQTTPLLDYWLNNREGVYRIIENPGTFSNSSKFRARAWKGDLCSDWTDWVYYSQKQYIRLNL